MSASVNPSIANFSIASTSSIASSDTAYPSAPKIRKRGRSTQEAKSPQKQRKVMGRPKNAWTASRRRKLVRLYLMTNLEVDEIAKVLRTENFKTCKRDIQIQLASLLQARPSRIRLRGQTTKHRLYQLREYRNAQFARSSTKYSPNNSTTRKAGEDGRIDTVPIQMEEHQPQTFTPIAASLGFGNQWLNPKWDALLFPDEDLVFEEPDFQQNGFMGAIDTSLSSTFPDEMDSPLHPTLPPLSQEDQDIEGQHNNFYFPFTTCSPVSLPQIPIMSPLNPRIVVPISLTDQLQKSREVLVNTVSQLSVAELMDPTSFEHSSLESANVPLVDSTSRSVGTSLSVVDHLPITLGALHPNAARIASLKKRLSLATDKYSLSTLEDIISLMENFTISTSSSSSSVPSRLSTAPTCMGAIEEHGGFPLKVEYPVILPGTFPEYCWEQITNNKLRLCNKGQKYRKRTLCRHIAKKPRQLTNDQSAHYKLYIGPKGRKIDIFGNTTLHIAATLATPLDILFYLIKSDSSIHVLNNGGQTFLHLINPDCVNFHLDEQDHEIDICTLLRELKARGFNFLQQDHHGRTTIHWLTRSEIPRSVLQKVYKEMIHLGIPIPASRDNIGCSILEQMRFWGVFKSDEHLPSQQEQPLRLSSLIGRSVVENEYIRNYTSNNLVETVGDLQRYAYQADLLRTINKSWKNPWFEDSSGRNGLHCLAEVTFDSPTPVPVSHTRSVNVSSPDIESPRVVKMEQTLDSLLEAGVDPNHYNKEGSTPLMAFIIHMNPGEDDILTTRTLHRLYKAGADINKRNRQGETCLHLAVKLGRRVATNFLISLKANVHVRANDGLGVVAIGHKCAQIAKDNAPLYAQIMLCISLAVDAGAVSTPTIIGEWGITSLMEAPMDEDQIRYKDTSWTLLEKL